MLDHSRPWTAAEYLALGETMSRVDLIQGALWAGPAGAGPHQAIVLPLIGAIQSAATDAGLRTYYGVNVSLRADTIVGPDLVVTSDKRNVEVTDGSEVVLLGEITSHGTVLVDRVLRKHLYAEAGIDWYLLVEPDLTAYQSVTVRLFRRKGSRYVQHAVAMHGQTLTSDVPFPFSVSTRGPARLVTHFAGWKLSKTSWRSSR
ncbi:Uma2 family endonuclease [Actinoplanes sp. NEAU-A12]|uniref:Uma2 family endonuclease n=1 Tax=Actinoplanes sandaracinus TaxID=3045177 RepID=A0ABT6WMC5_9ACTN|nr:Uma2 family endonuclease [Actinoplanes sandaracinus]MDI6100879.1 Uma2 family endonuclease [Actinoplanes sandaracinus]